MKRYIAIIAVCGYSIGAYAAPAKPEFSCEQIREKEVRTACQRAAKSKKADSSEDAKKAELAQFVARAKDKVIKGLLDPDSAKFTNLFVVTNEKMPDRRFLCGMVNAKNSYGGYVGAKTFYVKESLDEGGALFAWMSSGNSMPMELAMAKLYCEGNTVSIPDTQE